jgi:hypothetical protein
MENFAYPTPSRRNLAGFMLTPYIKALELMSENAASSASVAGHAGATILGFTRLELATSR